MQPESCEHSIRQRQHPVCSIGLVWTSINSLRSPRLPVARGEVDYYYDLMISGSQIYCTYTNHGDTDIRIRVTSTQKFADSLNFTEKPKQGLQQQSRTFEKCVRKEVNIFFLNCQYLLTMNFCFVSSFNRRAACTCISILKLQSSCEIGYDEITFTNPANLHEPTE